MKRDGIAFLALALIVTLFTGTLKVVLFEFFAILFGFSFAIYSVFYVLRFLIDWTSAPRIRNKDGSIPLNTATLYDNFGALQSKIYNTMSAPGMHSEEVSKRFLWLIQALQPTQAVPRYLINGVAKKMLYEYYRKYNTLDYKSGFLNRNEVLTMDEVLRPIQGNEMQEFVRFCVRQSC